MRGDLNMIYPEAKNDYKMKHKKSESGWNYTQLN